MKRILQVQLVISLIALIDSRCELDFADDEDSCHKATLDVSETALGQKYCCYIEFEAKTVEDNRKIEFRKCLGLTQTQFDDIKNTKDAFKELYKTTFKNFDDFEIDCNCSILKITSLIFGFLVLIF